MASEYLRTKKGEREEYHGGWGFGGLGGGWFQARTPDSRVDKARENLSS